MKILESDVTLLSSHSSHKEVSEKESLQSWRDDQTSLKPKFEDRLVLSEAFKSKYNNLETKQLSKESDETSIDPKLLSILRALEALTGKKIQLSNFKALKLDGSQGLNISSNEENKSIEGNSEQSNQPQRVGWGINYNYERTEIQTESLKFSAQGEVKTQSGQKIDFSLAMEMKNISQFHESISFKAGDALIDPLVINFDTSSVKISDIKHSFDLNLDGKSDEFSFVGSGSGFLVLDKNRDGIVNDGSELFGPSSGNGFKELAQYDDDKNGWIDENDAIYSNLLIWTKNEAGDENLYSMNAKDIGAIYLNGIESSFNLNNANYVKQGVLKESSVYLKESGGVGTIQEIDLKI